jgi:hypothetical protein
MFLAFFEFFWRSHFRPFTDVLRKIRRCVTRNILIFKEGNEDNEGFSFGLGLTSLLFPSSASVIGWMSDDYWTRLAR